MNRKRSKLGVSIAGVVIGVVILAFILNVLFPAPGGSKRSAMRTADLSNLKQMGYAQLMYMEDHDGYGPPPDRWMDALQPLMRSERSLTSPGLDPESGQYGYAYLLELGTIRLSDVQNPEDVPTMFDSSDLRRNVAGTLYLLPEPPRWDGGTNLVHLDGHAKRLETAPEFTIELP